MGLRSFDIACVIGDWQLFPDFFIGHLTDFISGYLIRINTLGKDYGHASKSIPAVNWTEYWQE